MFCIKICFLEPESVRAELLLTEPDPIFLPGAGAEKKIISGAGAEEKWLGSATLLMVQVYELKLMCAGRPQPRPLPHLPEGVGQPVERPPVRTLLLRRVHQVGANPIISHRYSCTE